MHTSTNFCLYNTTSGLYYEPMSIVNDNSMVVNKLEASLTYDARVVIYDRHMFIVQATGLLQFLFVDHQQSSLYCCQLLPRLCGQHA